MNDSSDRARRHDTTPETATALIGERSRLSLRVKAISFIGLMLLLVGALLSWYFLTEAEKGLTGELRNRAESLTQNLARSSKWGLLSEDEIILDEIVDGILREDSVLFVAISNARGEIIASKMREGESVDAIQLAILHAESLAKQNTPESIHYHEIDGVGTYHTYMPVESSPEFRNQTDEEISSALTLLGEPAASRDRPSRYGNVQLLVSSAKLFGDIEKTFITGIALTLLIVSLALAISYVFCAHVLGPVKAMAAAADKISAGDLTQRIKVRTGDEIGVLAATFNHMSGSLARMTRAQQERVEALSALHDAGLLINSTFDVDTIIERTLDIVVKRLGYRRALLFLANWDRRVLNHGRVAGADDEVKAQVGILEIPLEEKGGFCARVALSGRSVLVDNVDQVKEQAHAETLRLLGPNAFLAVPLKLEGRAIGVMAVESRGDRALGESDTALMETLANQMAIAVTNALSFKKIEQLNVDLEAKVRERTAELRTQQIRLEEVNEELTKATQHKSEFLANMSHELRTPLNAVIGYSELLQEEMEEKKLAEYIPDLRKIHSAGRHLLALINDVLDLSKIEAGKMDVHIEVGDIEEIVNEVVATIRPFIESHDNRFTVSCEPGRIRTDVTKLRQVLFNLLSNAAKFTEGGAVALAVSKVEGDRAPEWAFSISDTGIGIAPDKMDMLFEEFSQLDADVARKHGGTGLGLAISQRFCQMLGGEITVTSELGKGSTFKVMLPASVDELAATQRADDLPRAKAARVDGDGRCEILVIDDDPSVRDLVSRHLAKEGFEVRTAANGEEGLANARKLHPRAITLDLLMPGLDGWSVLTQLKADPELADIPVIIVTILDEKDMGYTLGAADYLTKPVDQQRLLAVLRQHCGQHSQGPVLIIEDDPDSRRLMRTALEKEGWPIVEAEDAETALAHLGARKPALILLDLILPGMDGFQFIETLHEHEQWSRIPIVVITAKDLSHKEHEFLNRSVQKIIKKGAYTRRDLLAAVRTTMVSNVPQEKRPT